MCTSLPSSHVHMACVSPRICVTKDSSSILEADFPFPLVPMDFLEMGYHVLRGICQRGSWGEASVSFLPPILSGSHRFRVSSRLLPGGQLFLSGAHFTLRTKQGLGQSAALQPMMPAPAQGSSTRLREVSHHGLVWDTWGRDRRKTGPWGAGGRGGRGQEN